MENNNEVVIRLQPKQKEAFVQSESLPVLFYGGAKGGGKSFLIRARQMIRRAKYPNTRGLIVRKTYPELRANHISKLFQEYPLTRKFYNKSEKVLYFPNGSTLEFSFLQSPDDVYTYQGREYDDIDIDEITQHEEEVFKILRTSNRTSNKEAVKAGMKPSMLLTGNPGGIGHQWVKRIFIDRQFKPEERPEDFGFVQAFVQDNRALLDTDPNYLQTLHGLPECLRKAYLDGDWNIHAGQAFSELSTHVHVIDPFILPAETRYFAGYDHGYNHPFAFVLFAVVPDGTVYVVKTLTARFKRPDEIYEMIRKACEGIGKVEIYAGLDLWSKQRDGSPSTAEQFGSLGMTLGNGLVLVRAKVDRIQGVSEIRKWIAWQNINNNQPKLFFFKNCMDVFNCVASMQFDASRPEDVLKVDADQDGLGGDDLFDAFRYGVMSRLRAPIIDQNKLAQDSAMQILENAIKRRQYESSLSRWR